MDILKEIFGTSDELQISKSLFESEEGQDHQPLSISLAEHSEGGHEAAGQPLPLLPTDPRPPLLRSQSLDDLHSSSSSSAPPPPPPPSSDEKDLLTGVCSRTDSFRPHSAFPHLSVKAGTTPIDLHTVPHEMPMYLLQEDEGNDEEIMQLLGTSESVRTIRGASADRNDVMMRSLRASRWSEGRQSQAVPEVGLVDQLQQLERSVKTLEMAANCDSVEKLLAETVALLPNDFSHQVCSNIDSSNGSSDSTRLSMEVSSFVTVDSDSLEHESHQDTAQNSPLEVSENMLTSVSTQSQALPSSSSASISEASVLPLSLPTVAFDIDRGLVTTMTPSTAARSVAGGASSTAARLSPQLQAIPSSVTGSMSGHTRSVASSSPLPAVMVNEGTQTSSAQAKNVNHAPSSTSSSSHAATVVAQPVYSHPLQDVQIPLSLSTGMLRALHEILQSSPLQTSVGDVDIQQLIDRNSTVVNQGVNSQANASTFVPMNEQIQQRSALQFNSSTSRPSSSLSVAPSDCSLEDASLQIVSQSQPKPAEISIMEPSLKSASSSPVITSAAVPSSAASMDHSSEHVKEASHAIESLHQAPSHLDTIVQPQASRSRTAVLQRNAISPSSSSSSSAEDSASSVLKRTHYRSETTARRSSTCSIEKSSTSDQPHTQSNTIIRGQLHNETEDMESTNSLSVSTPVMAANPLDLLMQDSFEVCVQWQGMKVGAGGSFMGLAATPVQILPGVGSIRESRDAPSNVTSAHKDPNSRVGKKSPSKATGKRRRGGGWPKGKKRKTEVEVKPPKAPLSGYGLFLSEKRSEVQHSGIPISTVSKLLGQRWSQMSKEEKQSFYTKAENDRQRYLTQLKQFLRESHKAASAAEQDTLDSFLEQSFANEADGDLLVCDTCGLVFVSLANKRTHYSGKLHMDAVLKQISAMSARQERTSESHAPQSLSTNVSGTDALQVEHANTITGSDVGDSVMEGEVEDSPLVDRLSSGTSVMHREDIMRNEGSHEASQMEAEKHSTAVNKASVDVGLYGNASSAGLRTDRCESSGSVSTRYEAHRALPSTSRSCEVVEIDRSSVPEIASTTLDAFSGRCSNYSEDVTCATSTEDKIETDTDKELSEKLQFLASSYLRLSQARQCYRTSLTHYAVLQQQSSELEHVMLEQEDALRELVGLCSRNHDTLRQLQLAVFALSKKEFPFCCMTL